jgi:hypothetical protein
MFWKQAQGAQTRTGPDWLFDACEKSIPATQRIADDPKIVLALSPIYLQQHGRLATKPIALLATKTNLIAAEKRFGRRTRITSWLRHDFVKHAIRERTDGAKGFEVSLQHNSGEVVGIVFRTLPEALLFGEYCPS